MSLVGGKSGSEHYALEFRDIQASTMSLDPGGKLALLAGRKYLTVVSLETKPGVLVRTPYGGKYEISCTQWSPMQDVNIFAIASSQRCDIFELTEGAELKCIARIKCHTRVITDLDWNSLEPNLFVTSSFDSYVHVWDMRCPRDPANEKPQVSLSALDGASQVRWSKWKSEILASCDGGHVKIWDIRKPTTPSEYIAAHASKINGLEWIAEDVVITAAQDCTVKFSRLAAPNPVRTKGPFLTLNTPVWRARPAPFGRGITVQSAPVLRRDSGLLSLWDWKRFSSPVYTFQAHDIVEFAWKKTSSYDLLTWSRDQTLRIWSPPREVIELCGEIMWPGPLDTLLSDDASSIADSTVAEDSDASVRENKKVPVKKEKKEGSLERKSRKSLPHLMKRDDLLQDEFETVSETMPANVNFDDAEVERGLLRFSWKHDIKGRSTSIVILASFPVTYPSAAPTFLVTSGGNEIDKNQLLRELKQSAQLCTRKGEPCLSSCINQFATFMKAIKPLEPTSNLLFPSRGVSNVPFPRTSGARFCFVGALIVFGRPSYLKVVRRSNADNVTPRSLSALGDFLSQVAHDESLHKTRRSRRAEKKKAGLVTIFDVSPLLPFNRDLAMNYKHVSKNANRRNACIENSTVSKSYKKNSVAHAWQAAAIISRYTTRANDYIINLNDAIDDDEEANWITYHPLGSQLIHSMITHYAEIGDVQTGATIACHYNVSEQVNANSQHQLQQFNYNHHYPSVVNGTAENSHKEAYLQQSKQPRLTVPKWWTKGVASPSPYHTVHGSDFDSVHSVVVNPLSDSFFRQHRSNSWSDSLDDMKAVCAMQENSCEPDTSNRHPLGKGCDGVILDPTTNQMYDCCKKSYAEILYRWGLLQERAQILKCLSERVEANIMRSSVEFVIECKKCQINVKGSQCSRCKKMVSVCSICMIPAKGLSMYCIVCGHGGHAKHIFEWFKNRKVCPTGCGCSCIHENAKTFK